MSRRGGRDCWAVVCCLRTSRPNEFYWWATPEEAEEAMRELCWPRCGRFCEGHHVAVSHMRRRWRVHSVGPSHSAVGGSSPGSEGGSTGQPRRRHSETHRRKIREAALRRWRRDRDSTSMRKAKGDSE